MHVFVCYPDNVIVVVLFFLPILACMQCMRGACDISKQCHVQNVNDLVPHLMFKLLCW